MVVIMLTLYTKAGQELRACGWMLSNHLTLDSLALSFDSVYLISLYQVVESHQFSHVSMPSLLYAYAGCHWLILQSRYLSC